MKCLAAPGGSVSITSPSGGASITGMYHITGTYNGVYGIQIAFNAGFLQNVHIQPTGTDQGNWYYDWTPTESYGNVEIMVRGFDSNTRYWDWAPYVNVTVNIPSTGAASGDDRKPDRWEHCWAKLANHHSFGERE